MFAMPSTDDDFINVLSKEDRLTEDKFISFHLCLLSTNVCYLQKLSSFMSAIYKSLLSTEDRVFYVCHTEDDSINVLSTEDYTENQN